MLSVTHQRGRAVLVSAPPLVKISDALSIPALKLVRIIKHHCPIGWAFLEIIDMRMTWLGFGVATLAALPAGAACAADVAAQQPLPAQAAPTRTYDVVLRSWRRRWRCGLAYLKGPSDYKWTIPTGLFTLQLSLELPGFGNVKNERDQYREGFPSPRRFATSTNATSTTIRNCAD